MANQILNIIFSIILIPVNLCCAFWLFREAMNLTGMTFKEFLMFTSDVNLEGASSQRRMQKRQRFLVAFFREKSSDPQKSLRLLWIFGICTLPGAAAMALAVYAALNPENLKYAFIGNLILVFINVILVIYGKFYRKNHPLDEILAERLVEKRSRETAEGRKNRRKNIIVYSLVGAFFFGILLFFMLLIAGVDFTHIGTHGLSGKPSYSSSISRENVNAVLKEKGYETAEIPVTYWDIDENKLMYVCAGVKGDSKFEYYEYNNGETIDLVYNQISYNISPDMEPTERKKHETELSNDNKMFTIAVDGVYYLVLYQGNMLIYAYSPESLDEINDILIKLGYLNSQ
ncbi:hypothetical protein [Hydrogeniiclostridium mannosilyticum]|uniref:hypothetical protein n=1 Tax=Hydrogeniiclostridium mannosilyticum TaxID=2764322 RepID=UPI0018A90C48|nr:hypothetical protein [Hydrogeniiclostridium mannosilyticum]